MRAVRKTISSVIYLFSILIIAFMAYIFINGYKMYIIESGSMEPTYPVGSVVFVKECNADELTEGEAITFSRQGVVVTHRIVRINEDGSFTTRGDANNTDDLKSVPKKAVIGRVEKCIINAGSRVYFLSTVYGKIAVVALLIIGNLLDPGDKKEKKSESKV